MFSASPDIKVILSDKFFLLTFLLPTSNIFSEISSPIMLEPSILDISRAMSAVPVAISRIFFGL